jgi:hypothetical protein
MQEPGFEVLRVRPPGIPPPRREAGAGVSRPTVELLALTVGFLQKAHKLKLDFSPRDGVDILEDLARRKWQPVGGHHAPLGLGDLYFSPDNPPHPEAQREEDENEI